MNVLTLRKESDKSLYKAALDAVKDKIKTSTSSMTAVPKPLKFLRPHYPTLEAVFESWPESENKVSILEIDSRMLNADLAEFISGHPFCSRHDIFR